MPAAKIAQVLAQIDATLEAINSDRTRLLQVLVYIAELKRRSAWKASQGSVTGRHFRYTAEDSSKGRFERPRLQSKHSVHRFSGSFVPPFDTGVLWSISSVTPCAAPFPHN